MPEIWNITPEWMDRIEKVRAAPVDQRVVNKAAALCELAAACETLGARVEGCGVLANRLSNVLREHATKINARSNAVVKSGAINGMLTDDSADDSTDEDAFTPMVATAAGVSFVFVQGVIWGSAGWERDCFGGVTIAELINAVKIAAQDDSTRVCLVINSPGGTAIGIDRVVKAVEELAAKKPLSALVMGMGCSAAYQIATPASEIVCVQSAIVGSIGSVLGRDLCDDTKANAEAGYTMYRIASGKYKAPSPGAIDQDTVNVYTAMLMESGFIPFRDTVVKWRGSKGLNEAAIDELGGRVLGSASALNAKVIDRVVDADGFAQELMLAAMAGGGGTVTPDRPENGIMAKNELSAVLAAVSVTDIIDAKPELKNHVDALVASGIQSGGSKAATLEQIEKICGTENKSLAFDLAKEGATLDRVYSAVNAELTRQRDDARTQLANVKAVRDAGGGGGANPVGGGGVKNGAEQADPVARHRALVLETAKSQNISVSVALGRVNNNADNIDLRNAWLNAGAPEIK